MLGSFDIGRLEEDPEESEGVGRGEAESVVLSEARSSTMRRGRTLDCIVFWCVLGRIFRQQMGDYLS